MPGRCRRACTHWAPTRQAGGGRLGAEVGPWQGWQQRVSSGARLVRHGRQQEQLPPSTAKRSCPYCLPTAGGFFKSHRDTPRGDPGFVGSLVVCLPVAHRGGALRIQHGRKAIEYSWGEGAVSWFDLQLTRV